MRICATKTVDRRHYFRKQKNRRTEEQKNRRTGEQKNRRTEEQRLRKSGLLQSVTSRSGMSNSQRYL